MVRVAVAIAGLNGADLERLAERLAEQPQVAVQTIQPAEIAAAQADFVLADLGHRPQARLDALPADLLARLVPVGIDRSVIAAIVKRHALPAIVEYGDWRAWVARPDTPGVIVGKKALLRHFHVFSDFFDPHYIMMDGGARDLPTVLADYLIRLRGR